MTCRDTLQCVHEPFGDAWYFGPERLSDRYGGDGKAREASGFTDSTYRTVFESIERENTEVGFPFLPLITRATSSRFPFRTCVFPPSPALQ